LILYYIRLALSRFCYTTAVTNSWIVGYSEVIVGPDLPGSKLPTPDKSGYRRSGFRAIFDLSVYQARTSLLRYFPLPLNRRP
jgi:hypothetical protein